MPLADKEDCMNKEYEPNWDQPAAGAEAVAAPTQPMGNGTKQIVTIRLDIDMLEWFKSAGPGYQTRVNQVLRDYMNAQRARAEEQ
jgi:uncharacterized protein (DUF4415 family)